MSRNRRGNSRRELFSDTLHLRGLTDQLSSVSEVTALTGALHFSPFNAFTDSRVFFGTVFSVLLGGAVARAPIGALDAFQLVQSRQGHRRIKFRIPLEVHAFRGRALLPLTHEVLTVRPESGVGL